MRIRIILLCCLLLATACSQQKSSPVQDAIQQRVAAQLGELKSMEFSELVLVDSTTFGEEIARRRHTIELRHKQNIKLGEGYQNNGKVVNATKKLNDALKDAEVLKGIDALEQRLAAHDSLGVIELYVWKFSARARTVNGSSTDIKDMFIAITPENEIIGMDYKQAKLLKGTGRLIPGYSALFDNQ